jgi:ubiquinone/menaquinone biosynthesis C-methylase UbiE
MPEQHFDDSFASSAPENYERYFVPTIGEPVAMDLMESAALRSGERVLDVGCGTGIVARLAAERVAPDGAVTGVDVNPGMLAVARSIAEAGVTIEYHEASAEAMPLPDESFDVALCQMSLQFMTDRRAALAEMRRVLVPDGRVVINLPGPASPLFEALADAMERHVSPRAAGFVKQVFSMNDLAEVRELLGEAGFREVRVDAQDKELTLPPAKDFLWQYVYSTPLAAFVQDADDAARAALEEEVVREWGDFTHEGGMRGRQRMVVASGRK